MSEDKKAAAAQAVANQLRQQLAQLETYTLSRAGLWRSMSGSGRRDYDVECDYPREVPIADLYRCYEREGVGRRVVALYPEESWAQDPVVYETESPDETPFEEAFARLLDRSNLWHHLHRVDELSGIGRFGVLLLGLDDGLPLDQPAGGVDFDRRGAPPTPRRGKPLELLYLRAFDESAVVINYRDVDPRSRRFGQPTSYSLTFQDETAGLVQPSGPELPGAPSSPRVAGGAQTLRVHWSRVVHVADNRVRSEVLGTPRMSVVYNRLIDLKKVLGGGSEMFWKTGFPGLSLEAMPGVVDFDVDDASLKQQIQDYQDGLQRFLALIGVQVKPIVAPVADPSPQYDVLITDICIALGCPKRVFMGSERGELASSQDAKTWNSRLGRRRDRYLTPMLVRPVVDRLVDVGVLPPPGEDGYHVAWPDLNASTDDERAGVAVKKSSAIQAYVSSGGESLIPPRLFLTLVLGMSEDEADEVEQAAEGWVEEDVPEGPPAPPVLPPLPGAVPGADDPALPGGEGALPAGEGPAPAAVKNAWSDKAREASLQARRAKARETWVGESRPTAEEGAAVGHFTSPGGAASLNRALAGEGGAGAEHVAGLKSLVSRAPRFNGDIHRGLHGFTDEGLSDFLKAHKKGAVVEHGNRFSSWTSDESSARAFTTPQAGDVGEHGVLLTVKDSRRSVPVHEFSDSPSEREHVVGPGGRYRVASVKKPTAPGLPHRVTLEETV